MYNLQFISTWSRWHELERNFFPNGACREEFPSSSHEAPGACAAAPWFLPCRYSSTGGASPSSAFPREETMTFAVGGWHCCTAASQPSFQNVSIKKRAWYLPGREQMNQMHCCKIFLEIILYKRKDLGFWEVYMLIKPPEECVNMHLNWMLAVDTV